MQQQGQGAWEAGAAASATAAPDPTLPVVPLPPPPPMSRMRGGGGGGDEPSDEEQLEMARALVAKSVGDIVEGSHNAAFQGGCRKTLGVESSQHVRRNVLLRLGAFDPLTLPFQFPRVKKRREVVGAMREIRKQVSKVGSMLVGLDKEETTEAVQAAEEGMKAVEELVFGVRD